MGHHRGDPRPDLLPGKPLHFLQRQIPRGPLHIGLDEKLETFPAHGLEPFKDPMQAPGDGHMGADGIH